MVTEKEKEIIKEHARQFNIKSVSKFLRIMGIDGTIFVVDESERSEKAAHDIHDSNLNADGIPLDCIREMLGHSELSTTLQYIYNPLTEKETYNLIKNAL